MTSRPSLSNQRQPQRSLSGSAMLQRSALHRSGSHPHTIASSLRNNENFVDLTLDGNEIQQVRQLQSTLGTPRQTSAILIGRKDIAAPSPGPIKEGPEQVAAQPPRGRPDALSHLYHNSKSLVDSTGSIHTAIGAATHEVEKTAIPLPLRPARVRIPCIQASKVDLSSSSKKDPRPRPYVLEVPLSAPHYPQNGRADFFPWTGNHPEDQFADTVIRQGHFDKSQTTQNETGSAKLSIFPSLKHKSGLQTLSSLFTHVLAQRRSHGQINSAPTFKPPPRVTLTDTKRETWLRDLANPTISLRRLSRTIPHGIRGKVLLEQCASKRIPTERAVWLAKCVGANEIRAFKRKGVTGTFAIGGENKWIRDWTIFVEQFIESIISYCGEKDWKGRILYAIRLAAHLYSEHLLDPEHYLDWLSMSLENCALTKVPVWLLICEIYWDDMLQYRKFGLRLVAALTSHFQSANENFDRDLLLPLIERMGTILDNLMKEHPENFIAPKFWSRCKDCLDNNNTSGEQSRRHSLDSIDRRNSKLRNPVSHTTTCYNPRRHLIDILDQSLYFHFSNVSTRSSWDISDNKSLLVRTLLEWTSSTFRPGLSKVYIGVRLLRLWSKSGLDVNHAILDFLSSSQDESILCKSTIYHLISELTRSGHFSILGYLHWLIARGGLRGPADVAIDAPCVTRLLAELPMHDIPDSIGRLRKILLKRAAFSVEDELETSDVIYSIIETSILSSMSVSEVDQHTYTSEFEDVVHKLPDLSRTIKSEIGLRLRGQVHHYTASSEPALAEGWDPSCTIHPEVFNLIRKTLEAIQDTTMLADVLKFVSTSNSMRVLASASDTLNFHFNELAAIGASRNIFNTLVRQRRFSVGESIDSVMLLKSLCDAAERFPDAGVVFLQLSDELGRVTHKTAADACSPVSDYMAEVFQKSENDFTDEIEKVLTSGTSMDSSTMSHLFQVLILRAGVLSEKDGQELRSCAILLSRLQAFDSKHFDSLLGSWLEQFIRSKDRPPLAHVLGYLISFGCLDFRPLLNSLTAFVEDSVSQMDMTIAAKTSMEGLSMLIDECDTEGSMMTDEDAYRLKNKRLLAKKLSRVEVLNLIRCAVELSTRLDDDQAEIYALSHHNSFRDLFRTFVLMDIESVSAALVAPLAKSPDSKIRGFINALVGSLLGYAEHSSLEYNFPDRVKMAMALANDITMPFCQMELRLIFASDLLNLTPEQIGQAGSLQAFEQTIDAAVAEDNTTWTSIIPKIDGQIARHLCHRAERMFLHLVPSVKTSNASDPALLENYNVGNRMLFVVNATSRAMDSIRNPSTVAQIVDKLSDILQLALQPGQEMQPVIEKWLPLMLDFIILHVGDFETIKLGSEARSRILLMLSSLLLDFQCSSDKNKALWSRVFDVALLLVDDLPEDSRIQCIRILKERTSDPALRYIFGYRTPATDWLQLQQKGKLTPYPLRRWEILSEPTPNVGENDTSLSLAFFKARRP